MLSPREDPDQTQELESGNRKKMGNGSGGRIGGSRSRKVLRRSGSMPRRSGTTLGDVPVRNVGGGSLHARSQRVRYPYRSPLNSVRNEENVLD